MRFVSLIPSIIVVAVAAPDGKLAEQLEVAGLLQSKNTVAEQLQLMKEESAKGKIDTVQSMEEQHIGPEEQHIGPEDGIEGAGREEEAGTKEEAVFEADAEQLQLMKEESAKGKNDTVQSMEEQPEDGIEGAGREEEAGTKEDAVFEANLDAVMEKAMASLLTSRSAILSHADDTNLDFDEALDTKGPSFDLHMGPLSVGTSGVEVKPQLKFGASGDGFDFSAGCETKGGGVKCGATAEVSETCEGAGNGIQQFLANRKCTSIASQAGISSNADTSLLITGVVLEELGIQIRSNVHVTGNMKVSAGVGVSGGMALGLWDDEHGYKMTGGGAAGVVGVKVGGELYVGVHSSDRRKVKFVLGIGPVTITAQITTSTSDIKNDQKAAQAQHARAIPQIVNGFVAVGWGYARGSNGIYLPTCAQKQMSFNECVVHCEASSNCIGFDSTIRHAGRYQQCCLRMKSNGQCPAGFSATHGTENQIVSQGNCAAAQAYKHNCGLVMAKDPYQTVGYGYCRDAHGRNTLKVGGQWNNWISQALCKQKCDADSQCTGIDTARHSGHCILRRGGIVGRGSNGWHSNTNSPCMSKVTTGAAVLLPAVAATPRPTVYSNPVFFSWQAAKDKCKAKGLELAYPKSLDDYKKFQDAWPGNQDTWAWVDVKKWSDGLLRTSDGKHTIPAKWYTGHRQIGSCGVMYRRWKTEEQKLMRIPCDNKWVRTYFCS